jgi:broad specificity phosphatase PhoE
MSFYLLSAVLGTIIPAVAGIAGAPRMNANDTEFFSVSFLQNAEFEVLRASFQNIVDQSFRYSAKIGVFAQQDGVYPDEGSLQLENFGALVPWSEILKMADAPSSKLLIMTRHGQAWENLNPYSNSLCEFELGGNVIPNFDSPLTPLGIDEARQLNEILLSPYNSSLTRYEGESLSWFEAMGLDNATFYTSPLSRTLQTAENVLARLPIAHITASEMIRASIGTDVCNFRRSVNVSTSESALPSPWNSRCEIPNDSLSEIYSKSLLNFSFPIRPAGGTGIGLVSDNDQLWRSDVVDDSHILRAKAFVNQLFEYDDHSVVFIVTHGEMIDAVYQALGESPYAALNTEVVPVLIQKNNQV